MSITDNEVLAEVGLSMPHGATQLEVYDRLTSGRSLSKEDLGRAMQTVSRILSTLAKDGKLDDSIKVGRAYVYRLPATKLPVRGTRTEQLEAEIQKLKQRISELEDARDAVCDQRDRLRERLNDVERDAHDAGIERDLNT